MCGRSASTLEASRFRQDVSRQLPRRSAPQNNSSFGSSSSGGSGNSNGSYNQNLIVNQVRVNSQQLSNVHAQVLSHHNNKNDASVDAIHLLNWIDQDLYRPTYNAGPTSMLPVVHYSKDSNAFVIQTMKWGLYPHVAKTESEAKTWSSNLINARSETVLSKAMFSKPLMSGKRCVCFVDGFYEWENKPSKQAYFIHMKSDDDVKDEKSESLQVKKEESNKSTHVVKKLMCFAALYNPWKPKKEDEQLKSEPQYTFTILTADSANTDIEFLHDRIPIILETPEDIETWLTADASDIGELVKLKKLLKPVAKDHLAYYKVSNFVNYSGNNDYKCLQKLEEYRKKNTLHRFFKPAEKVKKEGQSNSVKQEKEEPLPSSNNKRSIDQVVQIKKEEEHEQGIDQPSEVPAAKKIKLEQTD